MPDLSITATPDTAGRVRYDLGRPNWGAPVPDLRRPGATVQIPDAALVDVVVLGDGYTREPDFRAQLDRWLQALFTIRVYAVFAGAFRIRALYTPSDQPASASRTSFYGVKLITDETGVAKDDWLDDTDPVGQNFRARLWQSVDTVAAAGGMNLRRYSPGIDIGDAFAIRNSHLRDTYRNLVVSMLVRSADDANVSGRTTNVRRDPAAALNGRVAFGAHTIHEFSHAFGFLSDEYIDGRDRANDRRDPDHPSVLTLSNLTFSDRDDAVPWAHLAPTGHFPRTAGGDDPPPVAGWLWIGGIVQAGAWHSEYRCLMNGTHDNYAFTRTAAEDPTAEDGIYADEHGATLRDTDRFCAWCQEIITIRIHEKTDLLTEPGDPADPTEQGRIRYQRWTRELRENYYQALSLDQQIRDSEARYATLAPGPHGEPLWRSDLYQVPAASTTQVSGPPTDLDDGETHLLTGYSTLP